MNPHDKSHATPNAARSEPRADVHVRRPRSAFQQRTAHRLQPRGQPRRRCRRRWQQVAATARPARIRSSSTASRSRPARRSIRSIRRTCARSSASAARRPSEQAEAGDRGGRGRLSRLARHRRSQRGPIICSERPTIMRRRRFELAAWEVYECGKPWREADADVAEAIDFCEYYAREMLPPGRAATPRRARRGQRLLLRAARRGRRHRAVEFPAGDPLRHDHRGPGHRQHRRHEAGRAVVGHRRQADGSLPGGGLPPGVVNYLPGVGEEIGPTLVEHPRRRADRLHRLARRRPDDQPAGRRSWRRARTHVKTRHRRDGRQERDHRRRRRRPRRGGQRRRRQRVRLPGPEVLGLLARHRAGAALRRVPRAAGRGDAQPEDRPRPRIPAARSARVIDDEARQRILGYIEKGKQEARLAYAGDLGSRQRGLSTSRRTSSPTCRRRATIAQEEIFGPVLAVLKATDLDEALRDRQRHALRPDRRPLFPQPGAYRPRQARVPVGNLYINRKITGALVDRQPFGGFKLSGIGSKAGGPDYLLQFVLPRTITENTMRRGFAPMID